MSGFTPLNTLPFLSEMDDRNETEEQSYILPEAVRHGHITSIRAKVSLGTLHSQKKSGQLVGWTSVV